MIEYTYLKYTVSPRWILRKDLLYHPIYTLYNIDRRIILNLSPALYSIIKMLYFYALSINEITKYLKSKGIDFNYIILNQIEQDYNAEDLFVLSNKPYHINNNEIGVDHLFLDSVPITSTPMDAEVHLTHNCNLHCPHCFQNSFRNSDKRHHLSISKWQQIFKEFELLNMHNIIISGGEPLFFEYFKEVMEYAVQLRLHYTIMTNALLVNNDNIGIFKHKNVLMSISLDGHNPKIHDQIRGNGSFLKLERILKFLISNDVCISISHTINKINYTYIQDFIPYLISLGIKQVSFGFTESKGRASINNRLLLNKSEENYIHSLLTNLSEKYKGEIKLDFPSLSYAKNATGFSIHNQVYCAAGTKRIAISSDGKLYPCIYAFDHKELMIGDLNNDTIENLWLNSNKWKLFRGGIRIEQIHECNICDLQSICAFRNCRLKYYDKKYGLYGKPKNCLKDKLS